MKLFVLFSLTAALYGTTIPAPDLNVDGQQVVSPNVGAWVIPTGASQTYLVCMNDNPAGSPGDDQDFNDGCASAAFGPGNVLTVNYLGSFTSATNYIGVLGQTGWVGPGVLTQTFTYTPGLETIFTGNVERGVVVYLSGSGKTLNTPVGDYFYTECVLCSGDDTQAPEPSAFVLIGLGLAGLGLAKRRFSR